ncbi:MAG: DUF6046 domain-containing protein [Flavipsychrobacter sp.]|nr:DUF6046 domain-containing protein [Flavipsychrobacter sp.]
MTTSFSLSTLYDHYFGEQADPFNPKYDSVPQPILNSSKGTPYYGYDTRGRQYFLPAVITYELNTPTGVGTDSFSEVKKYTLPYPVISITSKKTIVETTLTERGGSVKELINVQDYDIVIKGFLYNYNNQFPEADVATLLEIFKSPGAVQLQNALTDIFLLHADRKGSDSVVVKDLSFPEVKGIKNVKPYQLTLSSDAIFNLVDIG